MRVLRTLGIIAFLAISAVSQPAISQARSPQVPPNDPASGHQKQFLHEHSDRSGRPRPDLWRKGVAQVKHMKITVGVPRGAAGTKRPSTVASTTGIGSSKAQFFRTALKANAVPGGVVGVQWTPIGPAPIRSGGNPNTFYSGQVMDIAIDPRNTTDQVLYLAANDGGIWKSTDGGASWKPKTDSMPSLSMGAVTLDPNNPSIVYAGTGNNHDGAGLFFKAVGIYKSIDAGDTWSIINPNNMFNGVGINRIVVLSGSGIILVATSSGLFKSVDSGLSFGNNAPNFNNGNAVQNGNITDLKADTTAAATVYTAVAGTGVFKSVDSGTTFGANSPTFSDGNPILTPTGTFGNIAITQSTQPDNQTMYASVSSSTANFASYNGLYKSTNGGAAWNQILNALPAGISCFCGYDLTAGVDPKDPNRLYLGFTNLARSTDGGVTFNDASGPLHTDHHAMTFSPLSHVGANPNAGVWVGNDGGIGNSTDGGASFSNKNNTLATLLMDGIDIGRGSAANNAYTYGGLQDNGAPVHGPADSGLDWHLNSCCDGGRPAVDPANPLRGYNALNGGCNVTTNGGGSWAACAGTNPTAFFFAFDPNNSSTIYVTSSTGSGFNQGNQLYQSTDNGVTFPVIKTFVPNISAIATDKLDSNVLWLGFSDGTLQRTSNASAGAGATWTTVNVTGSPGLPVGGIAIDPTNDTQVVVVYNGFSGVAAPSRSKHVFATSDNGTTWNDVSGTDGGDVTQNLPDLPLHSVVIDPGVSPHAIIVASDAAVMRSADNGSTWQVLGAGLPTVDSTSLQLDSSANPSLLRIGTYGRSVFELTASTGPQLAVNSNLAFGTVPVGGNATSIMQLFNVGSSDLHISSITRASGSADFSVLSGPATPVTLTPGEELDYTIKFAPTVVGPEAATFQINSDDPASPKLIPASGTGGGPKMAISGNLDFGTVARGTTATRDITVSDTGDAPLTISSVAFDFGSNSSFSVVGPATPQTISVGSHIAFTIQFAPPANSTGALRTGTLRIQGFDALFPSLTVPDATIPASGTPGVPIASVSSAALQFGSVAVDDRTIPYYSDQTLTITNQSSCTLCSLNVTALTITGPNATEFTLQTPPSLPAPIGAGNHLTLTIRFNPNAAGLRTAQLNISTDDPANPSFTVSLAGTGLLPGISAAPSPLIFGPTVYDPVCSPTCGANAGEVITNNGQTELILDALTFTGSAFSGPGPTSPPTRVPLGNSFTEVVTFHPTGGPARKVTGNLHIQDNVNGEGPIVAQDVPLCGESVGRGIRVLVKSNVGVTVNNVDKLSLQSHGVTNPVNVNLKNVGLTTINPPTSCQQIQFHYENQTLQAAGTAANPGSYYSLTAQVGSKHATLSFTLGLNEFKQITLTVQ